MKFYSISPLVENYKQLMDLEPEPISKTRYKEIKINGTPKLPNWRPPTLRWIEAADLPETRQVNYDKKIIAPDIAHWRVGSLVLSPKAISVLIPLFGNEAEFLPVVVGRRREDWAIMNIINMQDGVKEIIKADGGKTRWLDKILFDQTKFTNAKLFKIIQKTNRMFTSDAPDSFKEIVEKNDLTGIEFKVVEQ